MRSREISNAGILNICHNAGLLFLLFCFVWVLGIKLGSLCLQGKHFTSMLSPWPLLVILCNTVAEFQGKCPERAIICIYCNPLSSSTRRHVALLLSYHISRSSHPVKDVSCTFRRNTGNMLKELMGGKYPRRGWNQQCAELSIHTANGIL